MRVRLLSASGAAALLTLLAWTCAFDAYTGTRVRFAPIHASAGAGAATLPAPEPDGRILNAPVAVIVDLAYPGPTPAEFHVFIDAATVCDITVTRDSQRADCVARDWKPDAAHTVRITGPAAEWSAGVEVATHHGRSRGLGDFVVLPDGSRAFRPPRPAALAVLFAGVWLVMLLPAGPLPTPLRLAHRAALGGGLLLAIVVTTASLVTDYRVIVSIWTIAGWFGATLLPRAVSVIAAVSRAIDRVLPSRHRPVARTAVLAMLTASALTLCVRERLAAHGGNYSALLSIGQEFFDRNPLVNERDDVRRSLVFEQGGYDGQFMYFATFDPFLRAFHDTPQTYSTVVDNPPYRFARIGFPLLTRVFSLGRWQWFPIVMIGLIIAAVAGATIAMNEMARRPEWPPTISGTPEIGNSRGRWRNYAGVIALLIPASWTSLGSGLPEPVAAAFLVAGYFACTRDRLVLAGAAFAAALLVRETSVVLVLSVGVAVWRQHGWRRAFGLLALAGAPVVLWRLYLGVTLYPAFGAGAFFASSPVLGLPFEGMLDLWHRVADGTYYPGLWGMQRSAIALPIVFIAGLALAIALAAARRTPAAIAAVVYALLAMLFNFERIWDHVGNAQRTASELFVALALATVASGPLSRRLGAAVGVFWGLCGYYVFMASFDSSFARPALAVFGAAAGVLLLRKTFNMGGHGGP